MYRCCDFRAQGVEPPAELVGYYSTAEEQATEPEAASKPEAASERVRHLVPELEPPLTVLESSYDVIRTVMDYGSSNAKDALHPIIVDMGEHLAEIRAAFDALHEALGGAS